MTELKIKEREIIVPGEEIVKSMEFLPGRNCFREGEHIISKKLGLVSLNSRVVSVIPLSGAYIPRSGDMVIGNIVNIQGNGWVVDVKAPFDAFLPLSGVREYIDTRKTSLTKFYDMDDTIYAKVASTEGSSTYLSMQDVKARKFHGGRIVKISPSKVPRLIGKQGSMISIIKEGTGCRINAGQNGLVWIEGGDMQKCIDAIRLVETEAAKGGLTDRISKFVGVDPAKVAKPEKQDSKEETSEEA